MPQQSKLFNGVGSVTCKEVGAQAVQEVGMENVLSGTPRLAAWPLYQCEISIFDGLIHTDGEPEPVETAPGGKPPLRDSFTVKVLGVEFIGADVKLGAPGHRRTLSAGFPEGIDANLSDEDRRRRLRDLGKNLERSWTGLGSCRLFGIDDLLVCEPGWQEKPF